MAPILSEESVLSYLRCSSEKGIENEWINSEDSVGKIPVFNLLCLSVSVWLL